MTYFGRYEKPDGTWMKWLKFPGHDDAIRHCGRMAAGREFELLNEADYNLKYGEKPTPKETDTTGAFERLIGKLEEERNIEHFEESEDVENLEEGDSWEPGEKRKVGRPPRIDRPSKSVLQRLYVNQGLSIRAIAAELGLSRDVIHSSLKEHAIERKNFKESRLAKYPLELIREKVRVLGYERAARDLGVGSSTLYFYVKRR